MQFLLHLRFDNLQLQILAATGVGDILCGAGFNARIGDCSNHTRFEQRPRGCTDTGVKSQGSIRGCKLLELSKFSDCVLCTGAVNGEAKPTFRATSHSGATRPDLVIVSSAQKLCTILQ